MKTATLSRPEAQEKETSWMVQEMQAEAERLKAEPGQAAASAKAEAQRLKEKMPLPPASSEGKFEARFVQALIEIMTGKPTTTKPDMVRMPETPFEPIALVLSSTGQFYYRVTARGGCTCKGYAYRKTCRHYQTAFPEMATKTESEEKPQARQKPKKEKVTPAMLSEKAQEITEHLKRDFPELFKYARASKPGEFEKITLRIEYKDRYSSKEDAQVLAMRKAAQRIAPDIEIFIANM